MHVLIAAAWPYASGPRHLGHLAGAYLPADVCARYHRLAGDDVLMVSGSDCHGTPITVAAERAGADPAAFAAGQHTAIAASFAEVGISFDLYTTTTTDTHAGTVQDVFTRLHLNGFVTEGTERTAFCPAEQRSIPDRYVEGTCPDCGSAGARGDQCDTCGHTLEAETLLGAVCRRCGADATFIDQRQLFLRLDLLQPAVEEYLATRDGWRPFVRNESLGWLRQGLRRRSITRDLAWGVPVPLPGWTDRRLYVWFEAVVGYLSASIEARPDGWREWWQGPDAFHRYFVGKDNIPFHGVWWPAILSGAAAGRGVRNGTLRLPDDLVANHHLMLDAAKLSASRGHGITIADGVARAGVDPLRHALVALGPETQDVAFSWEQTDDLTRSGLLGAIANPVHRVTTLLWRRCAGRPDAETWTSCAERADAAVSLDAIGTAIRRAELRRALGLVHDLGRTVNRRLAETEPWQLSDDEARRALTRLLPYLDALGVAAWPFVPATASAIRISLGRAGEPEAWSLADGPPEVRRPPRPPLEVSAAAGRSPTPTRASTS